MAACPWLALGGRPRRRGVGIGVGGAMIALDRTCSGMSSACWRRRELEPSICTTTAWVEQPIQQGRGDHRIAEDVAPLGKAAVGGEDHGTALVAGVDERCR